MEALHLIEQSAELDLLLCDVVMPGPMDGYQFAAMAKEKWPSLKVLMTSGYTRNREHYLNGDPEARAEFTRNFLPKPYNRAELAEAVRLALDKEVSP